MLIRKVEMFKPEPARSPLAQPYALLVRVSLALALFAGFGLGLYLLLGFAFHVPLPASTPALMQAHGQAQTMGFVALFVMAVAAQLIPSFHGAPLDRPMLVAFGGLALAAGVVLRVIAQPAVPAEVWRGPTLVAAAFLQLAGVLVAVYAFARVVRGGERRPSGARALLPITLASTLLGALILNFALSVALASDNAMVIPFYANEALVRLELWGFASTMVLAVAGRMYPRFLFLQDTRQQLLAPALALWAAGALFTPTAWLLLGPHPAFRAITMALQLAGAALYVHALRLYEPASGPSPKSHVTDPTRRFVRVAFGFLLTAGALDVILTAWQAIGSSVGGDALSAARHAMAQGFLLPIMVIMAARILPGYAPFMLVRPRRLSVLMWMLFAGATLRVVAELSGGYRPGFGMFVGIGGALGAVAFAVFAIDVWRHTRFENKRR